MPPGRKTKSAPLRSWAARRRSPARFWTSKARKAPLPPRHPLPRVSAGAWCWAVVAQEPEGTYGYKITQQVTHTLELSESTLYPVLRRLQKDQLLTVYDAPFNGRNRRYYQITAAGRQQLAAYAQEWSRYRSSIDTFFREVE